MEKKFLKNTRRTFYNIWHILWWLHRILKKSLDDILKNFNFSKEFDSQAWSGTNDDASSIKHLEEKNKWYPKWEQTTKEWK